MTRCYYCALPGPNHPTGSHCIKALQLAVAKERERCAKIADNVGAEESELGEQCCYETANRISVAIRIGEPA